MKKILALAIALVMVLSVMCVGVSALDLNKKQLRPQIWLQDTAEWAWKECLEAGSTEAPLVNLGETREVNLTDFSNFKSMNSSAGFQYGFQICDETLDTTGNAGESSTIGFTISDITFKAEGYDDIVVPVAGSYVKDLKTVQYDWGIGDNNANFNSEVTAAISAVVGTNGADIFAYYCALTSVSYTITYDSYNGETAEGAAPAADPEPAPAADPEPAPAADPEPAPAPAPAPSTSTAPATGLALAVVPAVMALAAVAVSKKR